MPAIELNTAPADVDYDKITQKALFKLWLVLTTSEYTVNPNTKIFPSTEEAQAFATANEASTENAYFIDLEKLTAQLPPLNLTQVTTAFNLLKPGRATQPVLQATASEFWNQGAQVLGYGHVNCTPMSDVLDIDQPSDDAETA